MPTPRRTTKPKAKPPVEVEEDSTAEIAVRRADRWPFVRDIVLLFGGLAGVAYETLGRDIDRPTLLLLFAAMMGLPAFFPKGDK